MKLPKLSSLAGLALIAGTGAAMATPVAPQLQLVLVASCATCGGGQATASFVDTTGEGLLSFGGPLGDFSSLSITAVGYPTLNASGQYEFDDNVTASTKKGVSSATLSIYLTELNLSLPGTPTGALEATINGQLARNSSLGFDAYLSNANEAYAPGGSNSSQINFASNAFATAGSAQSISGTYDAHLPLAPLFSMSEVTRLTAPGGTVTFYSTDPLVVAEPGTLALLATGLAVFGFATGRRRQASPS